jgi:signal transduction histidine kinase
MNRLLNKALLYYTFFATIILLLSAPFIYWTMEKLYTDDVDEAIVLRKKEFETNNQKTLLVSDVAVWNKFNRDIRILPDTVVSNPKDSIIQETFYDALMPEWEPYRVLYTKVKIEGKPFVLMIQLNLVESEDLIKTIIWIYLGILFTLLLVIFFITRFISNRLWHPFYDTLQKIEQFNIEQHVLPKLNDTNVKEFEQLNACLEKLIQGNLQSYVSQKSFTENAAHELQTPLAIFQSKLDLLLQDASLTQPQAYIVQSLYEATSRLTRINKNLLLLAKIENNQFAETATFTINELVNDAIPYFTEQATSKHLIIEKNAEAILGIHANRGLIEIMVNNLLLNAVRHNIENGKILVGIHENLFIIANTGINQSLDASILFKRFGKGSADVRSSGLGLAIVKEICDRYSWRVSYLFKDGLHHLSIGFKIQKIF